MKKIFTLAAVAAVALSFSLTSCTKSAEDYAKEVAQLNKDLVEATQNGDLAKAKEIKDKINEISQELKDKADDKEFMEAYNKAYVEAMK